MKIGALSIILLLCSCSVFKSKKVRVYPLIVENRKILIPVTIKNSTYKFILDTGAAASSINQNLALKLKLPIIRKTKVAGAQRIYQPFNLYSISEILLGGIKFSDLVISGSSGKYAGTIGRDILLKNSSLYLNLQDNHFILNNNMELENKIPFNLGVDKKIFVNVEINNTSFNNFIFDTGRETDTITTQINSNLNLEKIKNNNVTIIDSTGKKEITYFSRIESICIEKLCSKNRHVMPAHWPKKAGYNGLIGFSFMKDLIFSIDFENRLIRY